MRGQIWGFVLRRLGLYIAAMLLMVVLALLYQRMTPPITMNEGYGFDGVTYGQMTRAFRGEADPDLLMQRPHFAYRPLVPFLVAQLPIDDIVRAYRNVNVVAFVLSGPALVALLRAYGASAYACLLAVIFWGTFPAGLRFAFYYPVLLDGVGLFLMIATLAAAAWRRIALFALLFAIALLVRENLVVLAPFLWIRLLDRGWRRATVTTALASLPALAAFVGVRVFPPLPPPVPFNALAEAQQNVRWLLENAAERFWRLLVAGPATLGLAFGLPILFASRSWNFLRRYPEWSYYVLSTFAIIVIGGADWDRYFLFFAPALLILLFVALERIWSHRITAVLFVAAQLLIVRAGRPVDPSEAGYLAYNVATMPVDQLVATAAFAIAGIVATLAIHLRMGHQRGTGLGLPRARRRGHEQRQESL